MMNTDYLKQKIQEIRTRDKAILYTNSLMHSKLVCSTMQVLQNLSEEADKLDLPPATRFLIRTIFAGYVLKSGDKMISNQNITHAALTTLQHLIKLSLSQEQQPPILQKLALQDYYHSSQHQQIIEDLHKVIGHDFSMSTPYDYTELMFSQPMYCNFRNIADQFMNLIILLPEVSKLTAEEIFIGSCLYICQKHNCSKIYNLLQEFFPETMTAADHLLNLIKLALETEENNS